MPGPRLPTHDIERQVCRLLASPDIPAAVRVRMACSVGAVIGGLLGDGLVEHVPHEQRIALVRGTVGDMFRTANVKRASAKTPRK